MLSRITLVLVILGCAALRSESFSLFNPDFMSGFAEEMKKFEADMKNLGSTMHGEMKKMKNSMAEMEKLTSDDLPMKVVMQDESVIYNLGGCFCVKFECQCCGMFDELNIEEPVCYEFTYLQEEKKFKINGKNMTEEVSVFDMPNSCQIQPDGNSLCIHFYNTKLDNGQITLESCCDLKFANIQAKLGCFEMGGSMKTFHRGLLSIQNGNDTTYLNQMNSVTSEQLRNLDTDLFVNYKSFGNL